MIRLLLLLGGVGLAPAPRPRLVVVITVDQLRPDYLERYRPQLLGGFEYMRAGQAAGVFWDTKLPVTDLQEAQARERTRRNAASRGR